MLNAAQFAGGVEYVECISTEEVRPSPNECQRYITK